MNRPIKVVKPESMDDELRRLVLALLATLKRKYPKDWRRLAAEIDEAKAA